MTKCLELVSNVEMPLQLERRQAIIQRMLYGGYSFIAARNIPVFSRNAVGEIADIVAISRDAQERLSVEEQRLARVEVRSNSPQHYDDKLWAAWQDGRRVSATRQVGKNTVIVPLQGDLVINDEEGICERTTVHEGQVAGIAGAAALSLSSGSIALIMEYEGPAEEQQYN